MYITLVILDLCSCFPCKCMSLLKAIDQRRWPGFGMYLYIQICICVHVQHAHVGSSTLADPLVRPCGGTSNASNQSLKYQRATCIYRLSINPLPATTYVREQSHVASRRWPPCMHNDTRQALSVVPVD
jgi:hypothetical protein